MSRTARGAADQGLRRVLDHQGFVVLDGGLATELEKRGLDLVHPLWSAKVLAESPEVIADVHSDYLRAGADCITAAGYQATLQGLEKHGFNRSQSIDLLTLTVQLAKQSRDAFGMDRDALGETPMPSRPTPLVAAGLGPYGAYLADGSEYRGRYGLSQAQLEDFHVERMEILWRAEPDLLAIETVPEFIETLALIEVLKTLPEASAWISFSCADGERLHDGTRIEECAQVCAEVDQLVAVGINCTAPRHLPSLIQRVTAHAGDKVVAVYPNSGESFDASTHSWNGRSDAGDYGQWARQWFDLGARMIGGCCRTGPEHILSVRQALENR